MAQTKKHKPSNRQPHPVDVHVGKRLRERRLILDITQPTLAERAGDITYQQLQKYEIAANRISASRLYEFSKALGVPVKYFFEGYTDKGRKAGKAGQQLPDTDDPVTRRQTLKLVRAYYDIADPAMRRAFLEMVRACGRASAD